MNKSTKRTSFLSFPMMQSPVSIFLIVALICSAVVYAAPIPDEDKLLLNGIPGEVEGHLYKRELTEEQGPIPPGEAAPGKRIPRGIPGEVEEGRVMEHKPPPSGLAEDRQNRELALQ